MNAQEILSIYSKIAIVNGMSSREAMEFKSKQTQEIQKLIDLMNFCFRTSREIGLDFKE